MPTQTAPTVLDGPAVDDPETTPARRPTPPPPVRLLGLMAALGAVLVALLGLFVLPSLRGGAHDLPVGVVDDGGATTAFTAALAEIDPDAFVTRTFPSQQALADAVRDRTVVGGFVVAEGRVTTLVASAGSTAISGSVTGAGQAAAAAVTATVEVVDVVPLPSGDPTGVGVGGLAFPLVFGGIVPVVAFRALFPRSTAWNVAGLAGFALVGGAVVATVLRFWFGSIEAAFWPVAGSMALGIAALALPLAGLQQLVGAKGFTVGAASMMFLGNPFSGIATTGAWLPAGLGTFGQLLPPGAAGSLVRAAAYFGGAGGLGAGLTLGAWVLAGVVMLALAGVVARRREPAAAVV